MTDTISYSNDGRAKTIVLHFDFSLFLIYFRGFLPPHVPSLSFFLGIALYGISLLEPPYTPLSGHPCASIATFHPSPHPNPQPRKKKTIFLSYYFFCSPIFSFF